MFKNCLTIDGAAEVAGRDRSLLSRAIKAGRLKAELYAGRYFIKRRDLAAYIRARSKRSNKKTCANA